MGIAGENVVSVSNFDHLIAQGWYLDRRGEVRKRHPALAANKIPNAVMIGESMTPVKRYADNLASR